MNSRMGNLSKEGGGGGWRKRWRDSEGGLNYEDFYVTFFTTNSGILIFCTLKENERCFEKLGRKKIKGKNIVLGRGQMVHDSP